MSVRACLQYRTCLKGPGLPDLDPAGDVIRDSIGCFSMSAIMSFEDRRRLPVFSTSDIAKKMPD